MTAGDAVDRTQREWERERSDIDVSSVGIVTRILRLARQFDHVRQDELTARHTDRGTIDLLGMLRRKGPPYRRTAGQLSEHSLISSGAVSQRLDKLESAGLLTRHIDTTDRRRVEVELTAAGRELVDAVLSDAMVLETEVISSALDEGEQDQMRDLLRKLLQAFE